jgi:hypothetical protein
MDHVPADALSVVPNTRAGGEKLFETPESPDHFWKLPPAGGLGDFVPWAFLLPLL